MKNLKSLAIICLIFVSVHSVAQTDKETTQRIVNAKNYTFVATTALPLNVTDINKVFNRIPGATSGGAINLSGSNYDLKITPDTVVSYLPYYGRAFTAPINRDDNGIRFTSTKFDYSLKKGKKRGWNVTIIPKDNKENVRMYLSISENGYATLSLNTTNRQSISYNGYLKETND